MSDPVIQQIEKRLAAPFDPREVKWKPASVSGNRALAIAYVDARVIQDRLDEVCGVGGWQDDYEVLTDGAVICRLRLRLGGEWITKVDVGGESEQPDEGDRRKAAFSDSLKRAAVKWGIGRYLYRLPAQWVDYDPHKKQLRSTPTLPESALPKRQQAAQAKTTQVDAAPKTSGLPQDGAELETRLKAHDASLTAAGRCRPGELLDAMMGQARALSPTGQAPEFVRWPEGLIKLTPGWVKTFEAEHPPVSPPPPPDPAPAPAPQARPGPSDDLRRKINITEVAALNDLLEKKGRGWQDARNWLGVRGINQLGDLTLGQCRQILEHLNQEADAATAPKR